MTQELTTLETRRGTYRVPHVELAVNERVLARAQDLRQRVAGGRG
jgi:hypothetical protein